MATELKSGWKALEKKNGRWLWFKWVNNKTFIFAEFDRNQDGYGNFIDNETRYGAGCWIATIISEFGIKKGGFGKRDNAMNWAEDHSKCILEETC